MFQAQAKYRIEVVDEETGRTAWSVTGVAGAVLIRLVPLVQAAAGPAGRVADAVREGAATGSALGRAVAAFRRLGGAT